MIVHWSLEVMVTLVIMMVIMVYRVEDGCTREKKKKGKRELHYFGSVEVVSFMN